MSQRLLFGVYPGGVTGDDSGGLASGPPDAPERVTEALGLLQGRPGRPSLVRAYTAFDDSTSPGGPHRRTRRCTPYGGDVWTWWRSTSHRAGTSTATAGSCANWSTGTAR